MATPTEKRESARARLLAAADELFYDEGIHTVGIDRVIERAGVAKGSLYYIFGSKDELVRSYLTGRHENWTRRIADSLASRYDTPRDRLVGVFDVLGDLFQEPDYKGCAFMKAAAEARPDSAELEVSAEFRAWVHQLFLGLAIEAGARDAESLSQQLVLLYDGASVASQLDNNRGAAAQARAVAAALVDAAIPVAV